MRGQKVFDKRVLAKMSEPKRNKVKEAGENCTLRRFMIFVSSSYIIMVTKRRRRSWAVRGSRLGRREMPTGFLRENRIQRDHLKEMHVWVNIIKIEIT